MVGTSGQSVTDLAIGFSTCTTSPWSEPAPPGPRRPSVRCAPGPAPASCCSTRRAFPRDKSCGDGIAPHALDELARLGAAQVLDDCAPVSRMRLRSPRGVEATAVLQRPDYVVPREVFDARLVAVAVEQGAELVQHTVRRLDVHPDRVVIDGEIEARTVVGADGANGVVRRQLGIPRQEATHRGGRSGLHPLADKRSRAAHRHGRPGLAGLRLAVRRR